ncbi:hypothetical protein VIGAN_02188600 [Vigna angularis var. angularis]|uniref:Uncharacterized protein n=1 Tax=Vigna angularis var. angularis TaxID=157739 RepID=A0A0S3REJ3_PHAAN|nr:hypothetical protein VIGAN_02188600 [Vigna angularis var. angularis]
MQNDDQTDFCMARNHVPGQTKEKTNVPPFGKHLALCLEVNYDAWILLGRNSETKGWLKIFYAKQVKIALPLVIPDCFFITVN